MPVQPHLQQTKPIRSNFLCQNSDSLPHCPSGAAAGTEAVGDVCPPSRPMGMEISIYSFLS